MTMVERVARAIHGSHGIMIPFDALSDDQKYGKMVQARAAIEAMRDVDSGGPQILVAGEQSLLSCSEDPELEDARKCWHSMIDASLKE